MGYPIYQAKECPLTGIKQPDLKNYKYEIPDDKFDSKGYQWYYPYNNNLLLIAEYDLYHNHELWDLNKCSIFYLLENDIWPKGKMVDQPLLEVLISSSGIPQTPLDKMNEFLFYLSINQKHFGERFSMDKADFDDIVRKTGMFNSDELEGIIHESANRGLLEIKINNDSIMVVILSLHGWEMAERGSKEKKSKTAFVAMSFEPEIVKIYNEWIALAISESGFIPKVVLDDPIESDQTVNDAILAGIKNARFTIADFTHHRNGVYFEAGYALGRGQKVIYTCREDNIEKAHFDTRNYQHLVWKDGNDLKKKLMDKIEVFIKN